MARLRGKQLEKLAALQLKPRSLGKFSAMAGVTPKNLEAPQRFPVKACEKCMKTIKK